MIPFILATLGGYFIGNSLKSDFKDGGVVQFVDKWDKDYRNPNRKFYYYERFNDAVGSFSWKYDKKLHEGILYNLSDFDKNYFRNIRLKKDEYLFRYKTDLMLSMYLIKINLDNGLIYFLDSEKTGDDDKNSVFYSRGIKADYIVLDFEKISILK